MQLNNEKYLHLKERHSKLVQENYDLRDELANIRKTFEAEISKVKQTNRDLNEQIDELSLQNTNFKTDFKDISFQNQEIKKKFDSTNEKSEQAFSLLESLKSKYNLVKDLNLMYRRFYSRNVIDQIAKDDFEQSMDSIFKDFNMAMQSKDNFIAQNMEVLERVIDKSSILKSESLRELMFGDLDEVIEKEAKLEKKKQKREERNEKKNK